MNITELARKNILEMRAYSSARSLYTRGELMDANESPFPAPWDTNGLNRYPDGSNTLLRGKLAAKHGLDAAQCAAGNGSDELLDILIRIFCEPGKDRVMISSPTYGMYETLAAIHNVGVLDVPLLEGFSLDTGGILKKADSVKMIFLCRPNNPTGNIFDRSEVLRILAQKKCIVVADEAYGEFMKEESLIPLIAQYPNLVVIKTLSKAYALAGARLGYLLASPEITGLVQKIKLPYNISTLASNAAIRLLDEDTRENTERIIEQREKLAAAIAALPGTVVFPSGTNFILFRTEKADEVFRKMLEAGIVIRSRTSQVPGCLRVSVGTPSQNEAFIDQLKNILGA